MDLPTSKLVSRAKSHRLTICVGFLVILGTSVYLRPVASAPSRQRFANQMRDHLSGRQARSAQNLYGVTSLANRKESRPRRTSRPRRKGTINKDRSVVGFDLRCLAPDSDNNVWAGGSMFLERGVLLQNDGSGLRPKAIPHTRWIGQLTFTSRDWGWMIADWNDLYRTIDSGRTWQKTKLDLGSNSPNLNTLYFSDSLNGWIGGWDGTILHTDDAGKTWIRQDSRTDLDIKQIQFANHLHGWASAWKDGYTGLFLTTKNSGRTWEVLKRDYHLYSFTFVNEFEGWAIEDQGIVHTIDGGQTWSSQGPEDSTIRSIFFLNDREGWASGENGILHTVDSGSTWVRINREELPFTPEPLLFIDSKHGWGAQHIGAGLLRTDDGGKSWQVISNKWQTSVASGVAQAPFSLK